MTTRGDVAVCHPPPLRTRHALLAPAFAAHRVFTLARPLHGVGLRVQTRWLTTSRPPGASDHPLQNPKK